jgi:hypothetical protein
LPTTQYNAATIHTLPWQLGTSGGIWHGVLAILHAPGPRQAVIEPGLFSFDDACHEARIKSSKINALEYRIELDWDAIYQELALCDSKASNTTIWDFKKDLSGQ